MPRAALTGKEKKSKRAVHKVIRELARGEHAPTTDLNEILQNLETAGKGAEQFFSPIKENAISEFEQLSQPQTRSLFGAQQGQGSRSSALNQALAAARGNLSRQLASDFAGIQSQFAQNAVNLSEQNKTNHMGMLSNLAQNPIGGAPSYLQKEKSGGGGRGALSGAISGGIQGFMMGGPWAGLAGATLGGVQGYYGGQGDVSAAAKAGGGYLQNRFNPVQSQQSNVSNFNQM